MALTVRTNGTGASNLITAQWFNDYHDLLTGVMADQYVTIHNGLSLKAVANSPTAPTLTLASGTSLSMGAYTYGVAFLMGDGESRVGATTTITTTAGNQAVALSAIPTGPAGTWGRRLYRTKVGPAYPLLLLTTINDNTTTTYSDATADSALGNPSQQHPTFGGALRVYDAGGGCHTQLYSDGAIWTDSGSLATDGSGNLTVASLTSLSGGLLVTGGTSRLDNGKITTDGAGDLTLQQIFAGSHVNIAGGKRLVLDWPNAVNGESPGGTSLQAQAGAAGVADLALSTTGKVILSGSGGISVPSGPTSLDNGNITTNGLGQLSIAAGFSCGQIQFNGYMGFGAANNVIDASGYDSWFKARGQNNQIHFQDTGGDYFSTGHNYISFPNFLGFKTYGGTKCLEIKGNGALNIAGSYAYGQGGNGFDNFDVAETYQSDADYAFGTVVCHNSLALAPDPHNLGEYTPTITQCTHDACALAMLVSMTPGSVAGKINASAWPDFDNTQPFNLPIALAGRVYAKTAYTIPAKSYVCSDGRGGVRAIATGQSAMAIGVTIGPAVNGLVPLVVKPTFVSL